MKKQVTLVLTEQCNLDCTYCYENHKSKRAMDFLTAKEIIDKELENEAEFEEITIDLFGGEPFIQFDLIKKIDDYLISFSHKTNIFIFMTTNGTLVHGEIKEWLLKRQDYVTCGLSYDGTDEVQDINRSNSSDLIDLDFFLKLYPQQDIKATISVESLPYLYDSMVYLHNKGFRVSCNLAYNIDWSDPSLAVILERELLKLIDFYIDNPHIEPCSLLNQEIDGLALIDMEHPIRRSYCGAGVNMKAYDLNGDAYPCQFFLPLSIGKEKSEASKTLHFYHDEIPEQLIEEKCRKCIIQSLCPNCFGANYASTGDMFKHDDNYCELTKIIVKARSYFKARQWELGQLNLSLDEETLLLKSIQIIQENL